MRNLLLLLVAIIEVIAIIPYFLNVLKGKSKPNLASWSTWTLLNAIVALAALAAGGAINTVVMGTAFFICSSSVLVLSLFKGTRKYTLFDGVCQFIALVGVILWQLTNNPNVALLFVILVDIFAITPTLRHSYLYPHEETWITYLGSGLMALAFIALAKTHTFASLAIPIESSLMNATLVGLIVLRGSKVAMKQK